MANNAVEEQRDELLALQAIFDEGSIVVTNEDPDAGPLAFKVKVPVQLTHEIIEVEVWLPDQVNCNVAKSAAATYKPEFARPDFTRSTSGHRWHSKFTVSNLTPIEIDMTLPTAYPAECPPTFKLSCQWLAKRQLSVICQQLDKMWEEYQGMPVVYTWIDWIQHHVLSFLGITSSVMIGRYLTDDDDLDERVSTEVNDYMEDMINMLRYDCQCEKKRFLQETHECGVCMERKPGEEFYRLNSCLHHFCYDCFNAYCELHVTAGTVQSLKCPNQKCETPLPPALLRQVLGDEKYQRWERLLLQKTLEGIEDIDWCVRCQMPATKESQDATNAKQSFFAYCTYCFYSYCTKCKDPWHAGTDCKTSAEKLQELEEKIYTESAITTKLEELYQKRLRLARLAEEIKSNEEIKKISKNCPGCGVAIQKNMGCNHMRCSQCQVEFCWRCERIIRSYDHFSDGSCILFPGQVEEDYMLPVAQAVQRPRIVREPLPGEIAVQVALRNPDNLPLIQRCPTCLEQNLKQGGNNHLVCWSCRSHFCFQCLEKIQGKVMDHFKLPSPCKQHSNGETAVQDALRNPDNLPLIKRCPSCGQKNLKQGGNNHLVCWSCRSNFCFQCLKKIQSKVMDHFKLPNPCKQHSNSNNKTPQNPHE